MQIIVAKRAGFCFGVKRAMDIAFKLARNVDEGVFSLGPLIHNPQAIEELKKEGVMPTEDINFNGIKTLIIRTHGISPGIYEDISRKGYEIVDATCPFVKKAQQHVQTLKKEGYQVLILGDKNHPEVQSLLGFAGDDAIVINSNEEIPSLKNKVGLIVQTTQPLEALKKVSSTIISSVRELKIYNTICDSTTLRLEETIKLADMVDLLIVVGGKNSANTSQLSVLSRNICPRVFHIETADELKGEWLKGVEKVGITGGASTPQWIIDDIVEKLKEISCRS
jgi:4-hydroxy-3-methylbut-2-enyl diphosphate reductase